MQAYFQICINLLSLSRLPFWLARGQRTWTCTCWLSGLWQGQSSLQTWVRESPSWCPHGLKLQWQIAGSRSADWEEVRFFMKVFRGKCVCMTIWRNCPHIWSVCVVLGQTGDETVWWRILSQRKKKKSLLQESGGWQRWCCFCFGKAQVAYAFRMLSSENVNLGAYTLLKSLYCCTAAFGAGNVFPSNVIKMFQHFFYKK